MRRIAIFAVCAVLAISLIGCSRETDKRGVDEPTAPPSSSSAGESLETPEPSEEVTDGEAAETTEPETPTAASVDEPKPSTLSASDGENRQSSNQQNDSGTQSKPPQNVTAPPAANEPPKADPPVAPTPEPSEPTKPKTAYDAPYDTAQIIANAKAYGESIGMTWSAPLTTGNCSWEAPIQTSSVLSGERLKEAIQSSIRRVKKLQADNGYQPGEFHFKLYLEPFGNGEYSLYFLMG